MNSANFEYAAPQQLHEAIALISRTPGALPLAGGHSLLLDLRTRAFSAPLLVDLRRIKDLHGIHTVDGGIRIGAMTTCRELAENRLVNERYSALAEAAAANGDAQVRARSTLAGNLAYNHPAGDLQAAALVLRAVIHVVGSGGERAIPIDSFFLGPQRTDLAAGEIITHIDFPAAPGAGSAYEKFKNPANGYAICGVAARVGPEAKGGECYVAVSGALPSPGRLASVESQLAQKSLTASKIAKAAKLAETDYDYRSDLHASAEYRAHLAAVLCERAVLRAAERADLSG
jgi:carbon-monoxide dehydrogenase medium subunit